MSLIRFAAIGAFLALSACAKAEKPAAAAAPAEWPPRPTKEFLALKPRDRNLAVYDAFVKAIESNYYDSKYFETDAWRAQRAQWREKAANAGALPLTLHNDVLRPVVRQLPESHFSVEYPRDLSLIPAEMEKLPPEYWKRFAALKPLMQAGPGIYATTVRRGNGHYQLVCDVLPEGSAAKHGVQPGWRLVNHWWTMDTDANAVHYVGVFVPLDAAGARAWERGEVSDVAPPAGDVVRLKFDLEMFDMQPAIDARRLAGGVQYVRFNGFGDAEPMKPVLKAIGDAGPAGLIIDLRWNGGGLRDEMQKVAAELFGEDVLLGLTQDRNGKGEMRAAKDMPHYEGPLVVLIGPGSGSASEILAAAVQDRKRGRLVGRMTNGSVLQSMSFALPDSGIVQVPVSNYFRIDGSRIEGAGVEPDVWILPTLDDVRAKRDPVLERALQELKK